jgi:adenylyltransferase/sulfurtransferase
MHRSTRYQRQSLFGPLGDRGQQQLGEARVLVCGCGALGSVVVNTLARAGIGFLRIVDRDFLELSNLQRQVLFTEKDVADGLPKAIAAAEHLREINSEIVIEPVVADVHHRNIGDLLAGIEVIVDGTDNFETRYLLNDAAFRFGIPWVYGGCLGAEGQTMTVVPGVTPCLRCVMAEPPPPELSPTCDTAGILAPAVNVVASLQAMEVIKLASGNAEAISRTLNIFDVWENRFRQIRLEPLREAGDCLTCGQGRYEWLDGQRGSQATVLCGRNSVQVTPRDRSAVSLDDLEKKLVGIGTVTRNPYLLRCVVDRYQLTIFPDGRAIVGGTANPVEARSVLARYMGQ